MFDLKSQTFQRFGTYLYIIHRSFALPPLIYMYNRLAFSREHVRLLSSNKVRLVGQLVIANYLKI